MSTDPLPAEASPVRVSRYETAAGIELHIHATPLDDTATAEEQLDQTLAAVASTLTAHGLWDRIVHGTLFVDQRLIAIKPERLGRLGQRTQRVTIVGQPPAAPGRACELLVHAVGGTGWLTVESAPGCGYVTSLEQPGCRRVWIGSVYPPPSAPTFIAAARSAFKAAAAALEGRGLSFDELVRTWIRLRDIGADYAALNDARTGFFADRVGRDLARLPASTGIEGAPAEPSAGLVVDLLAASGDGVLVEPLRTPNMCDASSYGAWFSRGVAMRMPGCTWLLVSGTASIDDRGEVVHAGDVRAQIGRTLQNVRAVLAEGGAGLEHVVSGVAYLTSAAMRPAWDEASVAAGLPVTVPFPVVEARVCRPAWLVEIEVMAALPSTPRRARAGGR